MENVKIFISSISVIKVKMKAYLEQSKSQIELKQYTAYAPYVTWLWPAKL